MFYAFGEYLDGNTGLANDYLQKSIYFFIINNSFRRYTSDNNTDND